MRILFLVLMFVALLGAQNGPGTALVGTVAQTPSVKAIDTLYITTDAASIDECETGSGPFTVLCRWNGSNWVPVSVGLRGSVVWDAPSTLATLCSSTTTTVTGAAVGMYVRVRRSTVLGVGEILSGFVSSADTVTIMFCNLTSLAVDPDSTTYSVLVQ